MPDQPVTEPLLDADRLGQTGPDELLCMLRERVADSVDSAAKLESKAEAERQLAARCRHLVRELAGINRTPLPQAGRFLEELRSVSARLAQDCVAPGNRDNPFRTTWEAALRRHRTLVSQLEQAVAGYTASQTVSSLRQALLEVFSDRCRAAGWFARQASPCEGADGMETLNRALELDPGFAAAYCARGYILAGRRQHRLASEDFTRAVELDPSLAPAWRGLGTALRFLQEYPRALAAFDQAIRLEPHSSPAHAGRGIVHRLMEDRQGSLRDLNLAIELDPLNTQAYNNRANDLWERGEHDRALEDYNRALELNPRYIQALNNRGNLYRDLKEYDRALADFARALEIDPDHTFVFVNRGNVHADLKQYESAVADYGRAIELDPDNSDARNNRGIVFTEMGRLEQALEDFDRAIELDPRHANAYSNRALIHTDLGRPEQAAADYSRAIALKPGESTNHLNLAELHLVAERYQELLACLQRADPHLEAEDDRLLLCYLRSIALRMLKLDSRESDICFERMLARVNYVGWSFDAIDGWLEKAFIEEGARRDIARLTQQLKTKTNI